MFSGPGLFYDIGKRHRDLLNKDYLFDKRVSLSSSWYSKMAFNSTLVEKGEKGELSTAEMAALYKYNNTLAYIKVDTNSNISTTLTITGIIPSTTTIASLEFADASSGKLEAQYFHKYASFTTAVGLKKSPLVDFTATVGSPTITFGVEAAYDTSSRAFTRAGARVGLAKPGSVSIVLGDNGDTLTASYLRHFGQDQKFAVIAEVSRQFSKGINTCTIGGSYATDNIMVVKTNVLVKAKLTNHGKLNIVLQPKSVVTFATEIDLRRLDKTPKFGLAIAIGP